MTLCPTKPWTDTGGVAYNVNTVNGHSSVRRQGKDADASNGWYNFKAILEIGKIMTGCGRGWERNHR